MIPFLSEVAMIAQVAPPSGGISPLAWVIIGALVTVCVTVIPALWYRGNKIHDQMYEDLKKCNEKCKQSEEDVLGLMKVLRLQMEASRGGKKG
jgi:hypothetical protein